MTIIIYVLCMNKIGLDIFSVYPEISFGNIESQKITEISFYNRNNRNINNNRNKVQKMFKMASILIGHKACIFFYYVIINIHKLEKIVESGKISCFEANTNP